MGKCNESSYLLIVHMMNFGHGMLNSSVHATAMAKVDRVSKTLHNHLALQLVFNHSIIISPSAKIVEFSEDIHL